VIRSRKVYLQCGVHYADLQRIADIISTVEFDATGNYLATGDKGGRVVLFERNESVRILEASAFS
jgi:serine/threonine-protein phosphatase 2A regulatory subunit B